MTTETTIPKVVIHDEQTARGRLVVTAHPVKTGGVARGTAALMVELDGRLVGLGMPATRPSAGAELTVGSVDFTADRGRAIRAAWDAYLAEHRAALALIRAGYEADLAAARASHPAPATTQPLGVTGDEADIEANYPGGLAAFRRDDPADRTPRHKGEIAEY